MTKQNRNISYKHIMPSVLRIKNGFKGAVVVSLLVTNERISIINARKPSSNDIDIIDDDSEESEKPASLIKRMPNYVG